MKKKRVMYLMVALLCFPLPMPVSASEPGGGIEYAAEDVEEPEKITEDIITEDETGIEDGEAEDMMPEESLPPDTEEPGGELPGQEEQLPDQIVEETVPSEFQEELIQEIAEDSIFETEVPEEDVLASEGGVEGFVSRMYLVALNREAEKAGFDDWVNRLRSGNSDGAAIAQGFIMSDEFTARNLGDSDYLDVLYHTFFDREADSEGKKTWTDKLDGGMSREYVLRGFVNSQEFQNLCDSFGIKRGEMKLGSKRDQNEGITMFVNRLYVQALGRKGESAGLEDWTGKILDHVKSPEEVAKNFFFSDEFTNKRLDNTEYVKVLYRTFMGREYDQAGLNDWVRKLEYGMSRERVLEGFSRSPEFANILASYGLSLEPVKSDSPYADEVIRLVNQEREKAGVGALSLNKAAEAAANIRARELVEKFSHTRPDGSSCFSALDEQGVVYRMAGENIAAGYASPQAVMNGWMNSPGHRSNILNEGFTAIGVGYYQKDGYNYWVQLFITEF